MSGRCTDRTTILKMCQRANRRAVFRQPEDEGAKSRAIGAREPKKWIVTPLLREICRNPILWLLAVVPAALIAAKLVPQAHTLLFILSVFAIVPLAALLSHATEFVAEKTGDAAGGLLNATLGNLTELVIAAAALRAGEYGLVKGSIAGAIVTNTLFMLGTSFLLGGLKHHLQEYNRATARLHAGLLFLATIALLSPSAIAKADLLPGAALTQKLSVALAVLLIFGYGLGLLFSLGTHREIFAGAEPAAAGEPAWPIGLALVTLVVVTVLVALVSEFSSSPCKRRQRHCIDISTIFACRRRIN